MERFLKRIFLKIGLLGFMGIYLPPKAEADCKNTLETKIQGLKQLTGAKSLLYSPSSYEKVLTLLEEAQGQKPPQFVHQFIKALSHKENSALSVEKALEFIRQLNEMDLLCKPKVLTYKDLLQKFSLLTSRLPPPQTPPSLSPLEAKKAAILHLEKAYQETQDCSPYSNTFPSPEKAISTLVENTISSVAEAFPCSVCLEETPQEKFFQASLCSCQGRPVTCRDCIKEEHILKLSEGNFSKACVCGGQWNAQDLLQQNILTPDQVLEWQYRELKTALKSCTGYIPCEGQGCPNGYLKNEKGFSQYLEKGCSQCGTKNKNCPHCERTRHPGKKCEEVWSAWARECEENGATACPTCWAMIQRTEGCMHMTCENCGTAYSEVTKLPLLKDQEGKAFLDHDIGGWPYKYFYPDGPKGGKGRVDQNGNRIDAYGNLIKRMKRPARVVVGIDKDEKEIYETRILVLETVIGRNKKDYFDYDPGTGQAWKLHPSTFERGEEIPPQKQFQFKGQWEKIIAKIKEDEAKKGKK